MANTARLDCDVLIVGYGPVGQMAAILLGRRGWRVEVVERRAEPYGLPRAVHYDDEIARVFAAAGVADQVAAVSEPAPDYDWRNAAGETLLHFDWSGPGPSGWPRANMFSQPVLERVLDAEARRMPAVRVGMGQEAVRIHDHGEHVEVTVRGPDGGRRTIRAAYVIGCDGAGSFVRGHVRSSMTDFGFFYDWLVVDVEPRERRVWSPVNLQICDPARPTTVVSGGPGLRRWEFMRLPGEPVEGLNRAETAWRLLAPWDLHPGNATLVRHTVYTFQARWADDWRAGRLLLAGDAAHLMPPFAGQGMCSGIRDVANLAWKLDLVLRGAAHAALLDTYAGERIAHLRHAIGMSVELGKVICITDPERAAARDAAMIAAGARPEMVLPPLPGPELGPGLLWDGPGGRAASAAGRLGAQGRVATPDGRAGLLDDVVGTGFVLASAVDPATCLTAGQLGFLRGLGAHVAHLVAPGEPSEPSGSSGPSVSSGPSGSSGSSGSSGGGPGVRRVIDIDGFYLPHLAEHGHVAALVRPDFYLFGAAATPAEIPLLVDGLRTGLADPAAAPADGLTPA